MDLHEFKASLVCIETPCLKGKKDSEKEASGFGFLLTQTQRQLW